MELSATNSRGKNVVGKDSNRDTMVAAMVETGVENTNIKRSSRLPKKTKK